MPLNYVEHIESTARRIRRRRLASIACWAFAALAAAVLALIAVDWLLGVYHVAGRVVLTTLLIAALAMIWRRGRRAARRQTTPLDVALELESRHSEHRSLLASALEFSAQEGDDPTAGSVALRRAVVLRASVALESIDLEATIPRAPLRRAAVAALAAAITLAVPAAIAPQGLATGVARLLNPLGKSEWPRRHDLAFVDPPTLVPTGGDFNATLRDRRGQLPRSVEVEYRTKRQGRWRYESQAYAPSGDSVEVRWAHVQVPFEYRARGGDHQSMPWRHVDTAPAPRIESLEITVHPPAYTGLPVDVGAEPLRIIEGSMLELHGKSNIPVQSGELHADGQPSVRLEVREDGRSFRTGRAKWKPSTSGEWSISLTTPQDMTVDDERRLRVEVAPDRSPIVEIVQPTEGLSVLPEASVDLLVNASDDLAVRAVRLAIAHDGDADGDARDGSPPTDVELYRGPPKPIAGPLELPHVLELSTLSPHAGAAWEVRARAEDYGGQGSESARPLRLHVISRDEFVRRIDEMLTRLAGALARALDDQQQARRRVDSSQSSENSERAVDHFLAALARQRAVAASLAGGRHSALELSTSIAVEYRRNHWPDDDALARVEELHGQVQTLVAEDLATIETDLATIARNVQESASEAKPEPAPSNRPLLERVEVRQDKVIAALEDLVGRLAQWSEAPQYQRELAELKAEQAALLKKTEAFARASLQNNEKQPSAGEDRGEDQLIARQRELASQLGSVLSRMRESAHALAATAPTDAARLDAAVKHAERQRVRSGVRAAADDLAARQFGQAAENQRAVEAQLQQLMERLAEGGQQSAAQRLAGLQAAEQRLNTQRRATDELVAERQSAEQMAADAKRRELDRLQAERQQLAPEIAQLARRVEQLPAAGAAQAAQRAANELAKSDASQASGQQAQREMQEAQRQLAAERRRQQTAVSKQQIKRLDAALQELVGKQQAIVDDALRKANSAELAKRQAAVRGEATSQADRIESFPVFSRLLRTCADTMKEAESLAERETVDKFVESATRALDELRLLADAVRQQRQQQSQPTQRQPKPNGGPSQENDPNRLQALQLAAAQLVLLRTMQAELQSRTVELERSHAAGEIEEAALRERSAKLAAEQRELTELAKSLAQGAELPPDEGQFQPDSSK